jgi:isoleucyl-tRNA synthetase
VKIRPQTTMNSMISSIKSRTYWCISRQRFWGLPIPCLIKKIQKNGEKEEEEVVINENFIQNLKSLIVKKGGIDFWWTNESDNEIKKDTDSEVRKSTDILDIWFDSGSSFNSVLTNHDKIADLYCEGIDQFTGWFQSSLLLSIATRKQSPYKSLLVHGFVVDENNHKMSKSLGNVIEPKQAIEGVPNKLPQCGLDVLRFWICHEYYKPQIQIGGEILEKFKKRVFDLRSVVRFIAGNIHDLDVDKDLVDYEKLLPIDKYILSKLSDLVDDTRREYDDMNLNKVISPIEKFTLTHLSGFYVSCVRDRLYCERVNSFSRRSSQTSLYLIMTKLLPIIAPIMPHLAEEAFHYSILSKNRNKNEMSCLFKSEFNLQKNDFNFKNKNIEELFEIIEQMRKNYFETVINNQLENPAKFEIVIKCDNKLYDILKTIDNTIKDSYSLWLTEFFGGCSSVTLDNCSTADLNNENKKVINLNDSAQYEFELITNKVTDKYPCERCRRFDSSKINDLCSRCNQILN